MRCVSIIPARGGSKGIPGKNIKPLAGRPLITYTISHSLNSKLIDETYVTTDDIKIKKVALEAGAKVIDRPKKIAEDKTPIEPVLKHAINQLETKPDIVVFLQCTSPIRKKNDINNAIKKLQQNNYDSIFSGTKNKDFFWRIEKEKLKPINYDYKNRKRRQDMPLEYIENGSIYVFKTNKFEKEGCHICGKIGIYEMPREYSFEIDDMFDFWLCEKILEWVKNE